MTEKAKGRRKRSLKLLFRNPVFREGRLNLTVRRGTSWFGKTGPVELAHALVKRTVGSGRIIDTMYVPSFKMLQDAYGGELLLSMEHDPVCRKWSKLRQVMIEAYTGFSSEDPVTLVFFMVHELKAGASFEEVFTMEHLDAAVAQVDKDEPRLMTSADIASFPTPGK